MCLLLLFCLSTDINHPHLKGKETDDVTEVPSDKAKKRAQYSAQALSSLWVCYGCARSCSL
jgi:hypothetical protein